MVSKAKIVPVIASVLLNIILSCSGGSMSDQKYTYESLEKVTDAAWENLSQKKIYFGHQSVGNNIIDGIEMLVKLNPSIKLNIAKTTDKADFSRGIFAHSLIGGNTNPQSKVADFVKNLDSGIGTTAEAAGLKFCYIDFNGRTDAQKLFGEYKKSIDEIKKKYPNLTIIHFTVPLLKVQSGPKAWVKKILGRTLDGTVDNIKRLEYNALLEKEFAGKDPIFDISKAESTYPDGRRETFIKDGKTYFAMVPAYTNDGGHLNENGKKVVAEQFLLFMVKNL